MRDALWPERGLSGFHGPLALSVALLPARYLF
jgi:hypothetical protein